MPEMPYQDDPSMMPNELSPERRYNGFIPACLISVSLIIILTYELMVAGQTRANARQLREQQTKLVDQSKQVQSGLEKIARDLIEVSKTDDDAKAIVTKYNISVANPVASPAPAKP